MIESEGLAAVAVFEALLDRPPHEVLGVGPNDDLIAICVAYAAVVATYNPVRFAGMAPAITQRVAFGAARLRTIFQQYIADVKQRARTRQSTQGRLHPDRR